MKKAWMGVASGMAVLILLSLLLPVTVTAQKEDMDFWLNFIPGANFDRLTPGVAGTSYIEIRNSSVRPLYNVTLSADKPEGWEVTFTPAVVKQIDASSAYTVDITVRPPESATRGDYRFAVIAEADGMKRISSIYVNVQPVVTHWLWIALGLAALLVAGFVVVFVRSGRGQ